MNLQIVQTPLNRIHTETSSSLCWRHSVFALTLTYTCPVTHNTVFLRHSLCSGGCVSSSSLDFCGLMVTLLKPCPSGSRSFLPYEVRVLSPLFRSLVCGLSPAWCTVAITRDRTKVQVTVRTGDQDCPPAQLVGPRWPDPPQGEATGNEDKNDLAVTAATKHSCDTVTNIFKKNYF